MDNINNQVITDDITDDGIQHRTDVVDKSIDNRLATIEGHIKAVRKMLSEDKSCVDIVVQLKAIESSIRKTGIIVLKNHLNNCIKRAMEEDGNTQAAIKEYNKILEMYL